MGEENASHVLPSSFLRPDAIDRHPGFAGEDEIERERCSYQMKHRNVRPTSHLPQPEAPPGVAKTLSNALDEECCPIHRSASFDAISIGKYLREKGSVVSAAIGKRISSLKETHRVEGFSSDYDLCAIRVTEGSKGADGPAETRAEGTGIKGRVSFFSRSGCRDCGAVRSLFREKGLPYVEINVDVFPERERELVERTGSATVPAIFFNEKLLGGLMNLKALRNGGGLEQQLRAMAGGRCPEGAPRPPAYGFDDEEELWEERPDSMVVVVRALRNRLPIQDRIARMQLVKNCFTGSDMVECIIDRLDCGRKKAVEIGKELAKNHFIHHVFRANDFEDGHNQLYRFLEHEPTIPRCFNFRGTTNDNVPKPAAIVGQRLYKLMTAIVEAYASNDRRHLDYGRIGTSEEFRRYVNLVRDLQRIDIVSLSTHEKLAFFLNLYNAMIIHAIIRIGQPGVMEKAFYSDFQYVVGGYPYSLSSVKNGILRSNRRQPYTFAKPFSTGDKRTQLALENVNPLIHFGLCDGTRSSPAVRFFSAQGVQAELNYAAREFFLNGGLEIDHQKRAVRITKIIKWYSADFGQEKDILSWTLNYLDATKAGLLSHLLDDGGPINISYQNFDWSLNC